MKLIYECNDQLLKKSTFQESEIFSALNKLSSSELPFVIIENEKGDYIQCAGNINGLVIEYRLNNEKAFKHYVIGYSETSKVWHTINCKVGPIRVLENEVLNINDAMKLFIFFFQEGNILGEYNKRNITKQFTPR